MTDPRRPVDVLDYAVPVGLERSGVCRDGPLIAKPIGATLPARCVSCNEPAGRYVVPRQHYYPAFRLIGSGVYSNIRIPLCAVHEARFRKRRKIRLCVCATGVLLVGAGLFVIASEATRGRWPLALLLVGVLTLCTGKPLRTWMLPLRLTRVTRGYLYLSGAGEPYLASLCTAEGPKRALSG